jgi:hypothetical protein
MVGRNFIQDSRLPSRSAFTEFGGVRKIPGPTATPNLAYAMRSNYNIANMPIMVASYGPTMPISDKRITNRVRSKPAILPGIARNIGNIIPALGGLLG